MPDVTVNLGTRSYPIYLATESLASFGATCRHHNLPDRLVIITDANVNRLYKRSLVDSLRNTGFRVETIVIPPGEAQKNMRRAHGLITKLLRLGISREAALIAFGGGVIGDLTGFVASVYRRGIPFVQCPTTLLSQADSSIGGKVGVNHPLAKNSIGAFHQPLFVFSDVSLLSTLPRRHVVAGLGEILKYPIVAGEEFFAFVESRLDQLLQLRHDAVLETAIRCAMFKATLVSSDERETFHDGGRMILNIGHAVGQTMETLSNYALHHGEAVLVGLRVETEIARALGILAETDAVRIQELLYRVDFAIPRRRVRKKEKLPFNVNRLVASLLPARFVLPTGIGSVTVKKGIPREVIEKALKAHLFPLAKAERVNQ